VPTIFTLKSGDKCQYKGHQRNGDALLN